jgi:hypothetical protein
VTVDFSPDALRTAATGALVAGIIVAVNRWRSIDLTAADQHGIPVVSGFAPTAHTSRQGWLARHDCYSQNPFACDPDDAVWATTRGVMSLREIAYRVWATFRPSIARLADPLSYAVARRVIAGTSPSWLDGSKRPVRYDDLGRVRARWPAGAVRRSRYEQVLVNAVHRIPLELDDGVWTPETVLGWSRVRFRRSDGRRRVMTLDALIAYLSRWQH